jgi:hypothetical protein
MRCFAGLCVRSSFFAALSIALLTLIGCTGSTAKPLGKLVPVQGKVTYKGMPAPAGCTITFIHAEHNVPASAQIAADGTYTLLFNGKPAVPVGTYNVSVTAPAAAAAEAASANPSDPEAYKAMMMKQGVPKGSGQAKVATIPTKYATPETSQVTFTVVEGQTTYDLELKD